jgi:hypothetical protein
MTSTPSLRVLRCIAIVVLGAMAAGRFAPLFIAVMFHPGGVEMESFQGQNIPGLIPTPVAAGKMMKVIDALTLRDTGRFLTNEGDDQPW